MFMSKAQLSLALVLVGLAASTMASSESSEQKKRRGDCGGLVEEPPAASSPAPGSTSAPDGDFHSQCPLILAFYNMSLTLTVEQRVIFEAWIQEIENTVLVNSSVSSDEKVVLISVSLRAFFELNIDIQQKLRYYQIANWGFVIDFLYVSISIQIEITQSVIVVDASGECSLTQAIKKATKNSPPAEKAKCDSLVVEIKAILADASLTYEEKMAALFELLEGFFEQNPDLDFLLSVEIEGYGSLQSFVLVAQTYSRITQLHVVLSGSSVNDCPLLEALQAAYQNTSYTVEQRGQLYQLIQKLVADFQVNVTISARLKVVSLELYQWFKLEPWMIEIIESIQIGEWGSIYDLIFCSGVCTNNGCGNINPVPTTTAVPSTKAPANCAVVGSLIVVTASNTTILTDAITAGIANWDATTKNGFTTTFNKIRRDIWNNVLYPTQASKLAQLNIDCAAYNSNNAAKRAQFYAIVIGTWGTVGDFVGCTA